MTCILLVSQILLEYSVILNLNIIKSHNLQDLDGKWLSLLGLQSHKVPHVSGLKIEIYYFLAPDARSSRSRSL